MLMIALMVAAAAPNIVATLHDVGAARRGIVAELIKLPAGQDGPAYAQALVEAEGLISWIPSEPTVMSRPGASLGYRGRTAGNGRTVLVYYNPSRTSPMQVCRMRSTNMGMSDERYRALRWCAASLGVTLPKKPSPPVAVDKSSTAPSQK